MSAYREKLNFSGEQKIGKNAIKINFQILMAIAPRCTKLHILYSDAESHFFLRCTSITLSATCLGVYILVKL